MAKANTKKIKALAKQAAEVMEKLDSMKPLYNELDQLVNALMEAGLEPGQDHYGLTLIDNFAAKNTVFRTTSVKRYELKKIG